MPQTQPMESSTRPTESPKQKGKAHVLADPESDPSFSDSPSIESDSSDDSNCRKFKRRTNIIQLMIANTENPKSRNVIKIKNVGITKKRTHQAHR